MSTLAWLAADPTDQTKAKCKYCRDTFNAHLKQIKSHMLSNKHRERVEQATAALVNARPISGFIQPRATDKQKILELKMAAFIAKNGSFSCVNDLTYLINASEPKAVCGKIKVNLSSNSCENLSTNNFIS